MVHSCFIDTDTNILWMRFHLLLIVVLDSKLYFLISYFGDVCLANSAKLKYPPNIRVLHYKDMTDYVYNSN